MFCKVSSPFFQVAVHDVVRMEWFQYDDADAAAVAADDDDDDDDKYTPT